MKDESAYRALRHFAERILVKDAIDLSPETMLDILRLVEDAAAAHKELELQSRQIAQLSEALRVSQRQFHELYETAPVAFVTLTKEGFIEMCNSTGQRLLSPCLAGDSGAAPPPSVQVPPLAGRRFSSFVAREDQGVYYNGLKKLAVRNETSHFELRLAGKSDCATEVHVQASTKLDANGRFACWHLALSDITDMRRKEAQLERMHEQLELATNGAALGLWYYDLKSKTSRWNDQLYLLLGLEPRPGPEEADYFFEFIHPEDRTGVVADLQSVLTMNEDYLEEEFRIVRADGRILWLASRGRLYRDERGEVVRIAGINYDITERKNAEKRMLEVHRQLSEQLQRTEQINEELSQYAYAVSHDLKGPLRAIRNYAEFLHDDLAGTLDGEQLKYLKGLKTAVDQGDALVSDLLLFSRVGYTPLQAETADVPGIVNEIRSGLDLPPDVEIAVQSQWPEFCADPTLLRQILHNLITNAVKFNRSHPRRVHIGCRKAPDDRIELFVRDNGIGIAPEYRKQVFRVFQRLHSAREFEGTGIGLAIVQKAVRRLGGEVRLASEPGEGSTFCVRLPREPKRYEENRDERYAI
jgi:PAS domain S-box-containing protein